MHYAGFLEPLESAMRWVVSPIFIKINGLQMGLKDDYAFFANRSALLRDYNSCLEENKTLQTEDAKLKMLEKDNEELKAQLNFLESHNFKSLTTEVVGRNLDGVEKMVMINVGEKEGVKIGQPVIVGDGILVGTIAKVEKGSSLARLIYDNNSKIAATVLNRDGSLGVVEGGYGLSVKMNFIPRNETIMVGDKIITSGMQELIPRGLLIGDVAVAENEAYQPFQQAILTTAADLSKLDIVSVLISSDHL